MEECICDNCYYIKGVYGGINLLNHSHKMPITCGNDSSDFYEEEVDIYDTCENYTPNEFNELDSHGLID